MQWEILINRNISWNDLEAKQRELMTEVHENKHMAYLMVSEPSPTFTFGRNSNPKDLLWSELLLSENRVQIAPVSRGGQWTYHGPGQLLVYPILHLPSWGYSTKSVRAFLEDFREGTHQALSTLGCDDLISKEPFGIYRENKKLVSFGLAFERSISSHGLALYYQDQSHFFSGITPCGVFQGVTTHLLDTLSTTPSWDDVAKSMTLHIKNHFSLRLSQVL